MLDGSRSTASWLRTTLRLAPGDAAERIRVGRAAFTGEAPLAEAMRSAAHGDITYDQVQAIARGTQGFDHEPARRAVVLLTDLARRAGAGAVRIAARHLRYVVDPDGAKRGFAAKVRSPASVLRPLLDGMYRLELLADPEGAAVLDAGLTALMAPLGVDDLRSTAQRRYDAVITVFRQALDAGSLPAVGGWPPQLLVTCTPEALAAGPFAAGSAGRPAFLPDGTPIPAATLDRVACDAAVARVVYGPEGEVLEYGRTRRLFSRAQRRAL